MAYSYPCGDIYVPSSWADHKYRNPPSAEPGTDYAAPYGSPVAAVATGEVRYVQTAPNGGTGAYIWIDSADGRSQRYLHLSAIYIQPGWYVQQGAIIGASGASGYGSWYYYGPHLHQTLLPTTSTPLADSVDFEDYVSAPPPPTPEPPPPPPAWVKFGDDQEEEEHMVMYLRRESDGKVGRFGAGVKVFGSQNDYDRYRIIVETYAKNTANSEVVVPPPLSAKTMVNLADSDWTIAVRIHGGEY